MSFCTLPPFRIPATAPAWLRLIHGCHQGTALRDFLQVEYGHHPQVKRLLRSPDGGATDLVLREMTE